MLNNPNIASYCFDEESQEWCEVQLRVTQFFFQNCSIDNESMQIKFVWIA
jgi:hypothetical protein